MYFVSFETTGGNRHTCDISMIMLVEMEDHYSVWWSGTGQGMVSEEEFMRLRSIIARVSE